MESINLKKKEEEIENRVQRRKNKKKKDYLESVQTHQDRRLKLPPITKRTLVHSKIKQRKDRSNSELIMRFKI